MAKGQHRGTCRHPGAIVNPAPVTTPTLRWTPIYYGVTHCGDLPNAIRWASVTFHGPGATLILFYRGSPTDRSHTEHYLPTLESALRAGERWITHGDKP